MPRPTADRAFARSQAPVSPARRASKAAALLSAGLSVAWLVAASGCASGGSHAGPEALAPVEAQDNAERSAAYTRAMADLDALAVREQTRPNRAAQRAPLPTGLPASAVAPPAPGSENEARSRMSVEAAVAALRPLPEPPTPGEGESPDAESAADALRLYVRGRSSLLAEDYSGAIQDLRAATRLDPYAPEPHRELAEAALRAGQQTLGVASMRRAIDMGSRDPRLLLQLARLEEQQGRPAWAASLYQAARVAEIDEEDSGVELLAGAGLGELLLELGYDHAGATLLSASLDLPSPTALRGSVVVPAVAELTRRLSDLWRVAGDGFARSGDDEAALAAYERASELPALDPGAIEPRILHAQLRLGRPAAAAGMLVRQIERDGRVAGPARVAVIRTIAEHGGPRRELAHALRSLASDATHSPSVRLSLALAEAAALPEREAAVVLDRALESMPDSVALLRARLRLEPRAESRVAVAVRRVRSAPDAAHAVGEALLNAEHEWAPVLARLESQSRQAESVLLLAYTRAVLGEGPGAYAPLDGFTPPVSMRPAFDLAVAELAPRGGRNDDAREALSRLLEDDSPSGRARQVRAVAASGDLAGALRLAVALVDDVGVRHGASQAMLASEIAIEAQRPDVARTVLTRLLSDDPTHEPAHRALITLHAPGGALADPARLADALRGLRERLPSSPTARLLASRELLERSLFVQAERALRELVELDRSVDGLSLLEQLWSRSASAIDDDALDNAEAWLRAQLERAPESPTLSAVLARVLLWQGRTEEAESFLREQIERRPHTALLRARETVFREAMQDAARADELALERLDRGPVSMASRLERMIVLARLERMTEAAEALAGLEATGLERRDIEGAVVALLQSAMQPLETAQIANRALDQGDLRAARAIFEAAAAAGIELPRDLHTNHMAVESSIEPLDADRLIAAGDRAVAVHPDLRSEAYVTIAARLAAAGRFDRALALAERLTESAPTVAIEAFLQVAVSAERGGQGRAAFDAFAGALLALHAAGLVDENERQATQVAGSLLEAGAKAEGTELGRRATDVVLRTGLDRQFLTPPAEGDWSAKVRRAEVLFMVAGVASSSGRTQESEAYYREVIELAPDHALAMNNLAYGLAVRGADLEEAERLAERAYALEPDNIHIIDTLGWVRYKLGVILDRGEDGAAREGALSLLRRAAAMEAPNESGIVLDQLGDASWVAGEREAAIAAWTRARRASSMELQGFRTSAEAGRRVAEITERMRHIDRKLSAARGGQPVPVSPTPAYNPERDAGED
ncbi:MAG: hypothetical protein EA378_01615 [Phycisphaerales bacterium]|nr:MAG: hypothetical protein EA378_01615 [Phycisphaerales bacterium]